MTPRIDDDLTKKLTSLKVFTDNLKFELQLLTLESSELINVLTGVVESNQPYNVVDNMLYEKILNWELFKSEIKHAQIARILCRIYEAIRDDVSGYVEKYQDTNGENVILLSFRSNLDERMMMIQAQLNQSEYPREELLAMIQQAKVTSQDDFNDSQKQINQITERFSNEIAKLSGLVCRSIRMKQCEKLTIAMQKEKLDGDQKIVADAADKDFEEKPPLVQLQKVLSSNDSLVDVIILDERFQKIIKHPKQTQKQAYLEALQQWIEDTINPPSETQRVALANYLLMIADHPLAKEKRYYPLSIFSTKTTSMAFAQGLLAKSMSDAYKSQLNFNEKALKRGGARDAYYEVLSAPTP